MRLSGHRTLSCDLLLLLLPGLHREVCEGTHRGAGRECQRAWNALLPRFTFHFFFGRICGAGRCASEATLSGSVPTSWLDFLTCRGWKAPNPHLPGPCAASSNVCASAAFQAAVNWTLSRLSYTRVPDTHPVTGLSHPARASCLPCHPCPAPPPPECTPQPSSVGSHSPATGKVTRGRAPPTSAGDVSLGQPGRRWRGNGPGSRERRPFILQRATALGPGREGPSSCKGQWPWVQGEKPLRLAKGITLVQSGGRTTQQLETGELS